MIILNSLVAAIYRKIGMRWLISCRPNPSAGLPISNPSAVKLQGRCCCHTLMICLALAELVNAPRPDTKVAQDPASWLDNANLGGQQWVTTLLRIMQSIL